VKLHNYLRLQTEAISGFFQFTQLGTNYRTEVLAGVTTFMTVAYILVVNPDILSNAIFLQQPRDLFGELLNATAISSAVATALIGLLANYPIALAPAMGLNAFFAFSVVLGLQIDWRLGLTTALIGGLLFIALILFGVHSQIIKAIPASLKYATTAGIGLFIAYIALSGNPEPPTLGAGIIIASEATKTALGSFRQPATLMAVFGLLLTTALVVRRIKGAMLWGIVATALLGWISGIAPWPQGIIALPQWPVHLVGQAIAGFSQLTPARLGNFLFITFAFLFVTLFDTIGALAGLGQQAGYIDRNGELPRSTQSLLAVAVGTVFGTLIGTSPVASCIESGSGICEGGRSGFASLVTAMLFLLSVFFTPLLVAIPAFATAPALILVGALMMSASIQAINWNDLAEAIPTFLLIITMPFTSSIASGLAVGFITYPLVKAFQGKVSEISAASHVLAVVSVLYFGLVN
jgi:adenine/guanine/hypoxanthine permease